MSLVFEDVKVLSNNFVPAPLGALASWVIELPVVTGHTCDIQHTQLHARLVSESVSFGSETETICHQRMKLYIYINYTAF